LNALQNAYDAQPQTSCQGIGYATEGRLRGGGIFENGQSILPAPAVAIGATLGIEVGISAAERGSGDDTSRTGLATVRFQVNGQHVSRPLDLGAVVLPVVPVVSLPANAELEVVPFVPCAPQAKLENTPVLAPAGFQLIAPANGSDSTRVRIWDALNCKVIAGNASPLLSNLPKYLAKYPQRFVYSGQDQLGCSPDQQRQGHQKRPTTKDVPLCPAASLDELLPSLVHSRYAEICQSSESAQANSLASSDTDETTVAVTLEKLVAAIHFAGQPEHQRRFHEDLKTIAHTAVERRTTRFHPDPRDGDSRSGSSDFDETGSESESELGYSGYVEEYDDYGMPIHRNATAAVGGGGGARRSNRRSQGGMGHASSPCGGAFAVGAPVLVANRGGGIITKVLANRWRKVRLNDNGSELSFKQKDLLEVDDGPGQKLGFNPAKSSGSRDAYRKQYQSQPNASARISVRTDENELEVKGTESEGDSGINHRDLARVGRSGGVAPSSNWVCCDKCNKWRRIPEAQVPPDEDDEWSCEMNDWDQFNRCWVDEEVGAGEESSSGEDYDTGDEDELNSGSCSSDESGRGRRSDERTTSDHQRRGPTSWKHQKRRRRSNVSKVAADELRVVEQLGAEAVWALPTGRLIAWVEEKPYAVAHKHENIADIAREFKCHVDDVLIVNAAVDERLSLSSVLTAGSAVLLPVLDDGSKRLWHELTTQLLTDGWKLQWVTERGTGRRSIVYIPPQGVSKITVSPESMQPFRGFAPANSWRNGTLGSLEEVVRCFPELIEAVDLASPPTAFKYLEQISEFRGKQARAVEVITPTFSSGDWVLAQWPPDSLWYLSKVLIKHIDGSYDLRYEDGDLEWRKDAHLIREQSSAERNFPRSTEDGRLYFSSQEGGGWVAYLAHDGSRVPGHFKALAEAELALAAAANATPRAPLSHSRRDVVIAAASTARSGLAARRASYAGVSSAFTATDFPSTINGDGLCLICLESTDASRGIQCDHVFESVCCKTRFHRSCVDLHVATACGARVMCPTCHNLTNFHRQLRSTRRLERFGPEVPSTGNHVASDIRDLHAAGWDITELAELIGHAVLASGGAVSGVVRSVDRHGRLVLECSDGTIEKISHAALDIVAELRQPGFYVAGTVTSPGAVPVIWKVAASEASREAQRAWATRMAAAEADELANAEMNNDEGKILKDDREVPEEDRGRIAHRDRRGHRQGRSSGGSRHCSAASAYRAPAQRVVHGSGPGFLSPGAEPEPREWACELCAFLNGQFARRCGSCVQGCQARSMVGRIVKTTSGLGKVAKSSGKGWVVVEVEGGGSFRMRLSQLWDYTLGHGGEGQWPVDKVAICTGEDNSDDGDHDDFEASASSGYALPVSVQRAGDAGQPRNWSFSLLKKRVQTSQGIGVVTDVIDKGWIGVRLESGRKIKTRPGNVTALEGDDEAITTFAKKTKATHAIKPPVLRPGESVSDYEQEGGYYDISPTSASPTSSRRTRGSKKRKAKRKAAVIVAKRTLNLDRSTRRRRSSENDGPHGDAMGEPEEGHAADLKKSGESLPDAESHHASGENSVNENVASRVFASAVYSDLARQHLEQSSEAKEDKADRGAA